MNRARVLATGATLVVGLLTSSGCALYTVRTAEGPAQGIPRQFFGVGPGDTDLDAFRKNGWALADSRDGSQSYVRTGSGDLDVSEAEAIVTSRHAGPMIEIVRLRFAETRMATYRKLLRLLIEKHGQPQQSDVRDGFAEFVLDPKSEHPRPARVVVHRWEGGSIDMVLVAGLEDPENLIASMDYQILLLPPKAVTHSVVP